MEDDEEKRAAVNLRLETISPSAATPDRGMTPVSGSTPRAGMAQRRRLLPPVKDSTIADLVYQSLNPKAYYESITSGAKRSLNSVLTFKHTTFSDVLSGLVCGILMSGFSAVFASTIFDEVELDKWVDIGVSSQQLSIIISGTIHIFLSDAPPVISAPDVNPTIFLGMMANIAQTTIMHTGNDSMPNVPELEPMLVATVLVITILSSSILGLLMILLGTFRWTRILELLPSSVLCGFMGSVGFTIFYKSLALSMPLKEWNAGVSDPNFWKLLMPAVILGLVMFFRERFQIGRPAIAVPLVMIFPVFMFSVIVFSSPQFEQAARRDGWLFPKLERDLPPAKLYELTYGSPELINWHAISNCIPTMVLMFLVVITDALLKLAGLKKTLQLFDVRADREVILMGKYNLLNGLLGGVPSYAQASLTRVSQGIVRKNAKSRIPGLIALVMNLIFLLTDLPLHAFMPRFWLSGILMFAGLQFLADNLVDSRSRLSKAEYFAVWMIIVVNYFFGLAWSVLLSLVLSTLIFTLAYGKEGAIKSVYSGVNYRSSSERPAMDIEKLTHLGRKVLILRLHRFIFFGSASLVNEFIKGFLDEQKKVVDEEMEATSATTGEAGKCTFFIFDFEFVEDIDHTALSILSEMIQRILVSDAESTGGEWSTPFVIFTALNQQLYNTLEEEKIVSMLHPRGNARMERVFASLDLGLEWVEDSLLKRAGIIRNKWLAFESFRKVHNQAKAYAVNDASDHVLGVRLGSLIFKYTRQLKVPLGATLFERGENDPCAYLIQSGRLTLYNVRIIKEGTGIGEEPETILVRVRSLKRGAFLNETVLYADDDAVPSCSHTAIADADTIVFSLNREDLKVLDQEQPEIAIELHRKISQHSTRSFNFIDKKGSSNDYYAKNKHLINANHSLSGTAGPSRTISPEPSMRFNRNNTSSSMPAAPKEKAKGIKGFMKKAANLGMDEDSSLIEKGQNFGRFMKRVGKTIMDMPLINESLVVAGFREDTDSKKGLLEMSSLNSGETSGRNIARELLFVDPADVVNRTLLTFQEYRQMFDTINEKVEADWYKVTGGSSIAFPDQVSRVFSVARQEANEMVWEADVTGRGGLKFSEFLNALITIDEQEIKVETVTGMGSQE